MTLISGGLNLNLRLDVIMFGTKLLEKKKKKKIHVILLMVGVDREKERKRDSGRAYYRKCL